MKKFYGTIEKSEKQADGTMIVSGYASSESKDVDGEVIKADAIKNALPDYMKFANVREMHKADKASGTVLEMDVQADGRTWIKTHIVDAEACKKVEHKVYKGFSIGGRVTERDANDKAIIKGIKLSEISLVDRPANPDSVFTFAKVDAGEAEPEKPVEEAKPDAAVDAAKTEETVDKAAKVDDLKKGMWAISYFASILSSIQDLQACAEYETQGEGDGSAMPAEIMAWLKQGGELLGAMVTEEVAEMTDDGSVEIVLLSAKATNLMKAACSAEDATKFEAFLAKKQSHVLAKSGKRNSAADQKHLNAIHDASCAMGATCTTDKAAGTGDDLQKSASLIDGLAKVLGTEKTDDMVAKVTELVDVANTLGKRVAEFEAMPKPPKAIVQVVEKNGTVAKEEKTELKKDDKATSAMEELKKVWGSGGKVE